MGREGSIGGISGLKHDLATADAQSVVSWRSKTLERWIFVEIVAPKSLTDSITSFYPTAF